MDSENAAMLLRRLAGIRAGAAVLDALRRASPAGTGVYLVGGAVRDLLLGDDPLDLDLAVEGEVAALARALGGTQRAHGRFGTCTVTIGGMRVDLARTRSEAYDRPGALPRILGPADIGSDLRRRDFTVNAIALGLAGADRGRLLAPGGALEDLRARRLRVLHSESFADDPTRILRLARYAARPGYSVAPDTRALAVRALSQGAFETVSGERIGVELRLLAAERDPVAALLCARELGADEAIEPGFGLAEPELARRALRLLARQGDRAAVTLAVALGGVRHARRGPLLHELAFPAGLRERVLEAAGRAAALADALQAARRPSEIAAAVGRLGPDTVALAGALGAEPAARRWLSELCHVRLAIDGRDLLAAGVPAGPAVGAGLAAARAAALDGRAVEAASQLEEALRAAAAVAG
ncbi:MAG TPA: hypothetical protein VKV27_11310 [Solirubrobacteraceae bacterium]|nr:hypothetical protein [Solirubrobacteraceae bacterium]